MPAKARPGAPRVAVAYLPRLAGLHAHAGPPGAEAKLAELERALGPFAGAVRRDPRLPGALVLTPGDRAELYGGLRAWAKTVREYLRGRGLGASVVVGFDARYAAAVASARVGVAVLAGPAEERARAQAVWLRDLGLPRAEVEALAREGVRTLGELLSLSPGLSGWPRREGAPLRSGSPGGATEALRALYTEGAQLTIALADGRSERVAARAG
jgi:hypothetical protein